MQEPKFNICTIDEEQEDAVPFFVINRDSLDSAIDTAKKMINPLEPSATEFKITTQCKKTFEQINLAIVYWNDSTFEASVVTFPLNIKKITT